MPKITKEKVTNKTNKVKEKIKDKAKNVKNKNKINYNKPPFLMVVFL